MSFNYSPKVVNDSSLVMYLDAANTKSLADVPSQNLLTYSQQFDGWAQYQSTVSINTTTAPDGTSTADTNIETSGLTGFRGVSQLISGMTSGQTYTFSTYAKNFNGRNIQMAVYEHPNYVNWYFANFNLQSGTTSTISNIGSGVITNTSMVSVGNGWYRCSISGYIPSATELRPYIMLLNSGNTISYTGDGVSGVYLWGGQFEVGNVATTYIPTTTAGVSRIPTWTDISKGGNNGTLTSGLTYNYSNGGSLVFDPTTSGYTQVNSTILNDSGGTINAWYKPLDVPPSGFTGYIFAAFGTNQDRFYLSMGNNRGITVSRGSVRVGINAGNKPLNAWYNLTMTWDSTTFRGYLNGIQFGDTTLYSGSGTVTEFIIGGYRFPLGDQGFNGYISQVSIYNRPLLSSEVLQNYNALKGRFGLGENINLNTDALILCLDASNPNSYVSGSTTWYDLSIGGNNGTLSSGITYNYSNGGSLVFDGINSYVNVPTSTSLEITSDLTINVWIYNTLSKSGIGIVTKGPLSGDYDYMLYLSLNSTLLNFWKKNSSGVVENGGAFITTILNTWVNVCFTKQGTVLKGYENGVLRSTSTFTDSNIRTSSNSLKIGNGWFPAFGGNIPQVLIYNKALSESEVLQNYNAVKGRFGL